MKTILMSMAIACSVVFGGCDVAQTTPVGAAKSEDYVSCGYTKVFRRATDVRVDYWTAVQLCAGIKGSLALPTGAAEQQAFYDACHDGRDPNPSCWSAWATPEASIADYQVERLHYAVCELWTP